ncbi:MAG TPA: TIGR02530 family flagellar biosynthesis protein [Fimbriimonadaceae bacterium]|nr:TIGR02530 family flagellar biosynthesis protein [Fimbriimonadaceae bacterium]
MRIQNTKVAELIQQPGTAPSQAGRVGTGPAFHEILQDRLKVSGHAQTRLQSRNLEMGKAEWDRVLSGIDKAAAKGAKDSLVMVDDIALVVSVKNRTVITAMDKEQLKDNVFTNIDSAVIV